MDLYRDIQRLPIWSSDLIYCPLFKTVRVELSFVYNRRSLPSPGKHRGMMMLVFINKAEIVYFGSRTWSQAYFT